MFVIVIKTIKTSPTRIVTNLITFLTLILRFLPPRVIEIFSSSFAIVFTPMIIDYRSGYFLQGKLDKPPQRQER